MKYELAERYTLDSMAEQKTDSKGKLFFNSAGMTDLSELSVIGRSVDTVKQLYMGTLDENIIEEFDKAIELEYSILTSTQYDVDKVSSINYKMDSLPLALNDFHISKVGKMSGYTYKLQNNSIGLIIFIKNFYKSIENEGSHLKIELSPHYISQSSAKVIQSELDSIARYFFKETVDENTGEVGHFKTNGVAVHLAVDVQNYEIPDNMEKDIVTRSKKIFSYTGIDDINFDNFSTVASRYGRNETLTLGSASGFQLSIYRKDIEMIVSDKCDYYDAFWSEYNPFDYKSGSVITRVEARMHHSIINEFARGSEKNLTSFLELYPYLNDLWLYSLETTRYMQDKKSVHPLWQMLMQDVEFYFPKEGVRIKRQQKKEDSTAISRNIALVLGNMVSLYARSGVKFSTVMFQIKGLSFFQDIKNYYYSKGILLSEFWLLLEKRILEKRLTTKFSLVA